MTVSLWVVFVGLALAVVVAVVLVAGRGTRRLEERLSRLAAEVAMAQQNTMASALSQVAQTVERFHQALADFGEKVQAGQQRELEHARATLGQQLAELIRAVNAQLAQTQAQLGERFEGATRIFGELKGQLGQVAEMAARMENLGKEIQELQDILKAPKLRGQMGEVQLEAFLAQVLPEKFWESQYRFKDGQVVDAVIRLRDHLVPVDAKFPLEAFQRLLRAEDEPGRQKARREFARTVKARVDEIAGKYIRPAEGTFDFALMFVPSENVYYEILLRGEGDGEESLLTYATARKVIPVSPNSFYAYLMTIVLGLKGMQVEAKAAQILAELSRLQGDFERLAETLRLVGRHLTNAVNQYQEAEKLAGRFADRLQQTVAGELPGGHEPSLPGQRR
ncbi:MAG: DNA recombination protein RmuC [Thermoanaerobaculum sp.]